MSVFSRNIGGTFDPASTGQVDLANKANSVLFPSDDNTEGQLYTKDSNGKKIEAILSPEGLLIIDHIKPHESFTHDGPVLVKSYIGHHADINIRNGGLTVNGPVGANVYIRAQTNRHADAIIKVTGGSLGDSIILTSDKSSSNRSLLFNGVAGSTVEKIKFDPSIVIKDAMGGGCTLKADNNIHIESCGKIRAQARGDIISKSSIGPRSELHAKGDIRIRSLCSFSRAIAGAKFIAEDVGNNCHINAAHDISIIKLASEAAIYGCETVFVNTACKPVYIHGERRVKVLDYIEAEPADKTANRSADTRGQNYTCRYSAQLAPFI